MEGDDEEPVITRRRPLLRFLGHYRRYPGLLTLVVVLVLAANAAMPLNQHLFGLAITDLTTMWEAAAAGGPALDLDRAWFWAALNLAVAVVRGLLGYLGLVAGFVLGQRLAFHIRDRLMTQVQSLDLAYHQEHGAGELIARTTRDSDQVREAVVIGMRMLLEMGLFLLAMLAFLTWYHWSLGLIQFVSLAAALAIMVWGCERLVRLDRKAADDYDALTQELTEGVAGMRVVKAFRLEAQRTARFDERLAAFAGAHLEAERFAVLRLGIPQFLLAVANVVVLVVAIELVGTGAIPVGHAVAAVMMATAIVFRVEAISRGLMLLTEARAAAHRLDEFLVAPVGLASGTAAVPADGPLGMRLAGVGVDIDGAPVLDRLSLDLAPGSVVALVGATGSGKSTLFSLLPRQRDPDRGSIGLVAPDGSQTPLPACHRDSLRKRVQVVHQQAFLFSDTIAANLRLAAPEADDEALWRALDAAAARDFVAEMDAGLAARVGEKGVTLSGGQRQRLCLARAILARPGLLVLDDSTSAVDALTEERIHHALRQLPSPPSLLLGASRLSTVLLADEVCLLEDGRIADRGRHLDLVARNARYRELLGVEGPVDE